MSRPNYGSSTLLAGSPVRETQSERKEYADLKTVSSKFFLLFILPTMCLSGVNCQLLAMC
jgi:hypothetical protein